MKVNKLIYINIYLYLSGVYGLVGQPKASKPEVTGSTPGSSCFSLVFIKKLINVKSKHKNKNVTICHRAREKVFSLALCYLYCIVRGPSQ